MEYMMIYDAQKQPTAEEMVRDTPVPNGGYRFVVTVLLFNEAGDLLIQKQQQGKKSWPGYWDYTAGGAVQAGESCYQAAERELAEEMGITLSLAKIPSRLTVRFEEGWNELYFVQWSGTNPELCLQLEEVAAAKWVNEKEYLSLINEQKFVPYLYASIVFSLQSHLGECFHI
ncbi:NUDIX domain-containing protein [Enterococcus sp.]|uniref:NUDIX hydrolase n=1 Tax=Enterococcus sp. TaxID=35783 RepID=UPI0025BD884A|nr:NUDIX domain-containing protein [Enterococcus sp.]